MQASLPISNQQRRALEKFVSTFNENTRMDLGIDKNSVRFMWVGSSPSHWVCVACDEVSFDQRILESMGMDALTSFPWAYGPNFLEYFAQKTLSSRPDICTNNLRDTNIVLSRSNAFSGQRTQNFAVYYATANDTVEAAAWALLADMPGSWVYSSQGATTSFDTPHPKRIASTVEFPSDMEYFHNKQYVAPNHEIQVDADGRVFALWLPAAARALGAPVALSVSLLGLNSRNGLLGLGNILGDSNRMAQNDPVRFRSQFAAALVEIDPETASSHQQLSMWDCSKSPLRDALIELDRRAALEEVSPRSTFSAKAHRL